MGGVRPGWMRRKSSRCGAGRKPSQVRRVIEGGLAAALAIVGLVAFATPAFAHNDVVTASATCASPLGTGYKITWTIENDYKLAETGSVTSVTYGLSTLNSTTYSIAASPGQPYSSTTLTQTLPATASGLITLNISSRWTDGFTKTDSGSYNLSGLNCGAPPKQTIAGHIYLCNGGNATTTEESGGTVGASGPTTVPPTPTHCPRPTSAPAATARTATAPPGYQLVVCGGSSTPSSSGTTATESVTVPSGGAGVAIFYVTAVSPQITQTIAGHIYLCSGGSQTTTVVSDGTLGASGPTTVPVTPSPLAPTNVGAGGYTMTATAPSGYQLVVCKGSSTPDSSGSTATEPVTVPSGGAGVGIFYVVATSSPPATGPTTNTPVATSGSTTSPTTPASTAAATTAAAATTPASTSSVVTSAALASTGAPLSWEWLIGLALLVFGAALVLAARWLPRPSWLPAGWLRSSGDAAE